MKKITLAIILLCACYISYTIGEYNIYMAADVYSNGKESIVYPHFYNAKEALKKERELANALFEGLHRFYGNDDNDAWFDEFVPTKEYHKLDSLLDGDWEDFYHYETPKLESWYSMYGTDEEPSEEYKDKINMGEDT